MMGTDVQLGSVRDRVLTSLGLIVKAPSGWQANGVTLGHQTYLGCMWGLNLIEESRVGKLA